MVENGNAHELIEDSIKLSRAINDLGALTVIGGIFLVIVIIMFLMFVYQVLHQQREISKITSTADAILKHLEDTTSKSTSIEIVRSIISERYTFLSRQCTLFTSKMLLGEFDKEAYDYEAKIFIHNLSKQNNLYLSQFEYNHIPISTIDNVPPWEVEVENEIKNLYSKKPSIIRLDEIFSNIFVKYLSNYLEKLNSIE